MNSRLGRKPSSPNLDLELAVWERASLSVMDIRHNLLGPGEAIREYRLPANAFVYACGGSGQVHLDHTPYAMERFGMFHGGKGAMLSILPAKPGVQWYMIMYKAGLPLISRLEQSRFQERDNPFARQYGFCPGNPVFYNEQLKRMHRRWRSPSPLRRFYIKAAFYQLVYEICEELDSGHASMLQPDLAAMAQRYMDRHYMEPISIRELSASLHISSSQLNRVFKQQNAESPQEYLIKRRLRAAQVHLLDSNVTLKEVAGACGFTDEYNLIRIFKNHVGVTPGEYRAKRSINLRDSAIGAAGMNPYTDERMDRQFNLQDKGDYSMRHKARTGMILTAMLGLSMMLSACGGGASQAADSGSSPAASPSSSATVQPSSSPEAATRVVKTVKGDVEVPAHPQKVAVNWYLGDLCALGITPVTFSGWKQETMPFYGMLDGVEGIEAWEAEGIMAYEPEVIVTYDAADFDKLSKIAPVLVVEESLTPEERLTFLGQALGREAEAKAVIDNFHTKLAVAKTKLTSDQFAGSTFSIFQDWGSGSYGVMYETGSRGGSLLYRELGLHKPEELEKLIAKSGEGRSGLSYEVAAQYFGDYVLWFLLEKDKPSEYAQTEMWKTIPAVKAGHVLEIPADYTGLFYYDDVLSMTGQLDYIMEKLVALVK